MRIFGGEQVAKLMDVFKMPENVPLEHGMVSKAIEQAQNKVEGFNFDARKHMVEYDDVANKQREIIYSRRRKILEMEKDSLHLKEKILESLKKEVEAVVNFNQDEQGKLDLKKIIPEFISLVPFDKTSQEGIKKQLKDKTGNETVQFLKKVLETTYNAREKQLGEAVMRDIEKFVSLTTIDRLWMDHLDMLSGLREGIGLRGYGQKDPLVEYKKEAFSLFEKILKIQD